MKIHKDLRNRLKEKQTEEHKSNRHETRRGKKLSIIDPGGELQGSPVSSLFSFLGVVGGSQ